jgi:predicted permease
MKLILGKRNYRFFIMFLTGVMSSIVMLIVNLVVYMLAKNSDVDPTVVIVVSSVAVGLIAVPLFGFLIFHLYVSFTGRTTREIIKKIKTDVNT